MTKSKTSILLQRDLAIENKIHITEGFDCNVIANNLICTLSSCENIGDYITLFEEFIHEDTLMVKEQEAPVINN